MTSRDVVNRVQRWFPRKTKIGHTGTLDPLATGVLVVCVGAATRLADYVQAMGKSYTSRFRLGATSTTDDADGDVTETPNARPADPRADRRGARVVRRHDRAGSAGVLGAEGGRPARPRPRPEGQGRQARGRARVRIDAIRVTGYEWPFLDVEVDCGKGTYIRSIARDLGAKLGCRRAGADAPPHARRAVHGGAGDRAGCRPREREVAADGCGGRWDAASAVEPGRVRATSTRSDACAGEVRAASGEVCSLRRTEASWSASATASEGLIKPRIVFA